MEPLFAALDGYDTWFTALRRDQSASRANLQEVEPFKLSSGKTISRVAPLAGWTAKDVWRYAADHDIPLLPLYDEGFTSIGCEPCTAAALRPQQPALGALAGAEAGMRDSYPGALVQPPGSGSPVPAGRTLQICWRNCRAWSLKPETEDYDACFIGLTFSNIDRVAETPSPRCPRKSG